MGVQQRTDHGKVTSRCLQLCMQPSLQPSRSYKHSSAHRTRTATLSIPRHSGSREIVLFPQNVGENIFFFPSATLTAIASASHEPDGVISLQLNSRRDGLCASS